MNIQGLLKKWLSNPALILLAAACLSTGGYIAASYFLEGIGFPLDDAWIHQTYARNLIMYGEWSFIPGHPSAGSTSPLWSALLSLGYLIDTDRFVMVYLLGVVCLWGIGILGDRIFRMHSLDGSSRFPWVGLLLVMEWHLVWASVSGMETLIYGLVILVVFYMLSKSMPNWTLIGLFVGFSVWMRPDGVSLLGPTFFTLLLTTITSGSKGVPSRQPDDKPDSILRIFPKAIGVDWPRFVRGILGIILGFCLIALPYLLFNQLLAGNWLPNTFFAKQAEYAELLILPLYKRTVSLLGLPMIGVGVLLLPGFLYYLWIGMQEKRWWGISAVIWWLGYTLLYAIRLPVSYQHGRYLIPAMPIFFILGFIGLYYLGNKTIMARFPWRILRPVWLTSIVSICVVFYFMGSRAFAQDVAVIETEMVATAKWISNHTEPESLIAAHDIGALGYFGQRDIVDLAGLVSPEVIPFVRDETKLELFLIYKKANFIITAPGWEYPEIVNRAELVYKTDGQYSPRLDYENMKVYRWLEK
jgi:hypothetical protein